MATPIYTAIAEANRSNILDADLYAAESQSSDTENIAGSGNLNVGVVVDYDANRERKLQGAAQEMAQEGKSYDLGKGYEMTPAESANQESASAEQGSYVQQQTATFGSPNLQSFEPEASGPRSFSKNAAANDGSNYANEVAVDNTNADQPDNPGGDSSNTSTTNSYNTTINNTYNDSHDIYHGDTIGGDIPDINIDLPDIDLPDIINNTGEGILQPVLNTVNNLGDNVTEILGDIVNVDSLLQPVLDTLSPVTNQVTNILGDVLEGGLPTDILGTVTDLVGGVLDGSPTDILSPVTDIVDDVLGGLPTDILSPVTDILDGVLGGDSPLDILAPVTDIVDGVLGGGSPTDILSPVTDIVEDILGGGSPTDILAPVTDLLGGGSPAGILQPVLELAGGVGDVVDDAVGGLLGGVPGGAIGGDLLDLNIASLGDSINVADNILDLDVPALGGNVTGLLEDNGVLDLGDVSGGLIGQLTGEDIGNIDLPLISSITNGEQGDGIISIASSLLPQDEGTGIAGIDIGIDTTQIPLVNEILSSPQVDLSQFDLSSIDLGIALNDDSLVINTPEILQGLSLDMNLPLPDVANDLSNNALVMDILSNVQDTSALGSSAPVDGGLLHAVGGALDSLTNGALAPAAEMPAPVVPLAPILQKLGGLFG